MIKLESKEKTLKGSQVKVYNYISDFRNFRHLLPTDHLKNIEINQESCSFTIDGFGAIELKIAEKTPYHHLKIISSKLNSMDISLVFQLEESGEMETKAQASLNANLNIFMEMMARNPLQNILDMIMDKLSEMDFTR